jgi:glucose/arabinose dehydrogenase
VLLANNNIYAEPIFKDNSLKAELVTQGLNSPTSMAFLDQNNILLLEKNSGNVLLVSNGILIKENFCEKWKKVWNGQDRME